MSTQVRGEGAPRTAAGSLDPLPGAVPADDMHDTAEDLGRKTRLGQYLQFCRDELLPPFRDADDASLTSQRKHRAFARWAAVATTAAALFALSRKTFGPRLGERGPLVLLLLEGLAILATLALVVVGLLAIGHTRWLLRRYQAEQIRLLKFRFLADASFWTADAVTDVSTAQVRERLERIRGLARSELGNASQADQLPAFRPRTVCDAVGRETLAELVDYYKRRRLAPQRDYFGVAADRAQVRFLKSPLLVPTLFFLGLLVTVVDWISGLKKLSAEEALGAVGVGALGLVGGMLALWKGVRAYRGASEFSRNASRSRARRAALQQLEERLAAETDPAVVFAELALCEYILAGDQQEWLRLMLGAKWYG